MDTEKESKFTDSEGSGAGLTSGANRSEQRSLRRAFKIRRQMASDRLLIGR